MDEYSKKLEYIRREKMNHKGEWLTVEGAEEYVARAKKLLSRNPVDVGERRELRTELQERYGLTELEAINILNGNLINDYVNKYYRIKNEIVDKDIADFNIWIKNEFTRQNQD